MSERDPFDTLRDLIDEPVAPRDAFADGLRSRLMREMSASEHSREEQRAPMDAVIAPRPPVAFPIESVRRIRPMVILELAAAAVIILGLVAALNRGWFQGDPDPATAVPAAILQDDSNGTPETQPEPTSTPLPTIVPERTEQVANADPIGSMEPTVVPPGNIPNTVWAIPPEGEDMEIGGLLVDDDTVYRLLSTSNFVGVQAIDAETGAVKWQQAHRWAGTLLVVEDEVLYFDGGGNTLTAVDANSGAELWRAALSGDPMGITEDDDHIFVILNNDLIEALDKTTGEQRWAAQGSVPAQVSGGSASDSGAPLIAVEESVVASISTTGVLSGFDVQTGEEIWAHEGFEAATSAILTEGDLFIVVDGVGLWVDSLEADGVSQVSVGSVTAPGGAPIDCAGVFQGASGTTATPVAAEGAAVADSFIIQAIDPKTGEILWEDQTVPGGAVSTFEGASFAEAGAPCAIEVATGNVVTVETDSELDDHLIIGNVSNGVFVASESDDDLAALGGFLDSLSLPSDTVVMLAVADDDNAYLQLADGTLVKVHIGDLNDDDGSPEPESEANDD